MRCTHCHSYIPEGLQSPIQCPHCGQNASPSQSVTPPEPKLPDHAPVSVETPLAFASYFTVKTWLSFGLANMPTEPSLGSLSFGSDGFSIVWDRGKHWEKFYYRDLSPPKLFGDSVLLSIRDVESKLTLFHPWLPRWMSRAREKRALVFMDLLTRVKAGLTATEITTFQRRLQ